MQALAEEWRRRDGEREALVKKKVRAHSYIRTMVTHYILYYKIFCSYKHMGEIKPEFNECKLY